MIETSPFTPATPHVRLADDGSPYLAGVRCTDCGQFFLTPPVACPRCFSRKPMDEVALSGSGRLYSYTIVHRSFPGVKTPFVMAVVDLDGGPTVRATLADVPPHPAAIAFDMPVRLEFRDSGQRDAERRRYLSYVFVPAEECAQ